MSIDMNTGELISCAYEAAVIASVAVLCACPPMT